MLNVGSNKIVVASLSLLTAVLFVACSGDEGSEDSASSGVSVSGTLSGASGLSSKLSKSEPGTLAITDYSVRCVTFDNPPVAGVGSVNASGEFTLTMAGASETSPFGCFLLYSSNVVATMVFEDSSKTSMSGSNAQSSSYTGGGKSLSLGTITVDEDKGKMVVDKANITGGDESKITGTFSDMTGAWIMSCISDASLGYSCDEVPSQIYLNQFTVNDGTSDHTGLSIWESQNAFTTCGSTEDLDGILQGTWTSASFNADFSFSNLSPADFTVDWVDGSGNTVCDYPATEGVTTCDSVTNAGGWGNGTITYTTADCQAMCVANSIWSGGTGCMQDYQVDWSKTRTASAGDLACNGSSASCGVNTGAGFIAAADAPGRPRDRFVINELLVSGNTASLFDEETQTETICVGQTSNSSCTDVSCTFTRFTKLSIKQESATTAVIEVAFHGAIDSSAPAACSQEDSNNWILDEIREQKMLFKITKQ